MTEEFVRVPFIVLYHRSAEHLQWGARRYSDLPSSAHLSSLKTDIDIIMKDRASFTESEERILLKIFKIKKPITGNLDDAKRACDVFVDVDTLYDHGDVIDVEKSVAEVGYSPGGKGHSSDFPPTQLIVTALVLSKQVSTSSGVNLGVILEEGGPNARESAIKAARKRPTPSTGAEPKNFRSTQRPEVPDAAYNYSPPELTPSPISIYHFAFARFKDKMATSVDEFKFTSEELKEAKRFIDVSLASFDEEKYRHAALQAVKFVGLPGLFKGVKIHTENGTCEPDGTFEINIPGLSSYPIIVVFLELKNGLGEGGSNPSNQVQLYYIKAVSSSTYNSVREMSCCPAFLVAVSGQHLDVWGAVTAEKFFFEPLAHIFLGPKPEAKGTTRCNAEEGILEVAKVLQALKEGAEELEKHYEQIPISIESSHDRASQSDAKPGRGRTPARQSAGGTTSMFPVWNKFITENETRTIEYIRRLTDFYDKPVFLAKMHTRQGSVDVVVKFTKRYCVEAHKLLEHHKLAPKLFYAEYEGPESTNSDLLDGPGMRVIVMEYINNSEQGTENEPIDSKYEGKLREAVTLLHENRLVFGDLRRPNILTRGSELFLVDFDWCGSEEEGVRYPVNIRMEGFKWCDGVGPGELMKKEHDSFRVTELLKPKSK